VSRELMCNNTNFELIFLCVFGRGERKEREAGELQPFSILVLWDSLLIAERIKAGAYFDNKHLCYRKYYQGGSSF